MMSFGCVFPPLAILGFISICSQSYFILFMTKRFAREAKDRKQTYLTSLINRDCSRAVIVSQRTLWYAFPASTVVLAFFIFDIIGSSHPGDERYSAIVPAIFVSTIVLVYLVGRYHNFIIRMIRRSQNVLFKKQLQSQAVREENA